MKIACKGFNKNLKCKEEQFEIGKVYEKPHTENPRLCSADGFHYSNTLKHVFNYYSNNGENRFCLIEVLGSFTDCGDKSVTTSFRIIREIQKDEIEKQLLKEKEKALPENMGLEIVRKLQGQYPTLHVGGSTGLFLHGIRLKRYYERETDLDMISPYFILLESFGDMEINYADAKASANDFDETFICNSKKVDFRIDPKQRYEIIVFEGFRYKVSPLEVIMAAKIKYALNGQKKHKDDIAEMVGKKTTEHKKATPIGEEDDLPW